jgi:hypothetical protein
MFAQKNKSRSSKNMKRRGMKNNKLTSLKTVHLILASV